MRHWNAAEMNHRGIDLPMAAGKLGNMTAILAKTYLHTHEGRGAIVGNTIAAVLCPVFGDTAVGQLAGRIMARMAHHGRNVAIVADSR